MLVLYNERGGPFATSDVASCFLLKMICGGLFEPLALMQTLALIDPVISCAVAVLSQYDRLLLLMAKSQN